MLDRNKRPQLYGARRHPYYLVSPGYDRLSSGIRVMHQLCHSLNRLGEEAYIETSAVSARLNTPRLTDEIRAQHRQAGLNPIAIYPEIVGSNPLDCDVVVRYILNKPGLFGETPNYQKSDLFWLHNGEMVDLVDHVQGILHMPACDTSIFNNRDNPDDECRQGACIYFGRYEEGREKHADLAASCTEITKSFPATHEDLAALLRRSTHIYCFENTSISMEARLCGCPVVQLPSPYVDLDNLFGASLDLNDALVRDDDPQTLAEARALLPALQEKYVTVETNYWLELKRLVSKTQRVATRNVKRNSEGSLSVEQAHYALWRSRRTLQEIDGQLHAERMLSQWRFRPKFALGIRLGPNDGELLANTIDALARQWYPEWQLVVFAPDLAPPPELAEIEQIAWLSDPATEASFAALRAARDAEFYALLPAGTIFEDHALQSIADEINASPQWLAVYTDHDEMREGQASADPHFKPDFNPELLYSRDYIGPTAFVCREAIDAFGDGAESHSDRPLGLLLRIFEQTGHQPLGHIADPLIHCPAIAHDEAQQTATLAAHFERRGRPARIESGWFKNTRRVRFDRPADVSVSVVVMTHSQPGYLKSCLETLMETAGKAPNEVIVVAHAVDDPDLDAYLDTLAAGSLGIECTVLREEGEFRPAEFRNRAAKKARGDYLLFVDDDTEYFHEDWLDAMLGHAVACGLSAVGPRLVSSTDGPPRVVGGGKILGLEGFAADVAEGTPSMVDSRWDLRLQLDQGISALPATCLLVNREHFNALGGFDAEIAPLLFHDLDWCMRSLRGGGRLAWMATIDVAHQQGITVRQQSRTPAQQASWLARQESERTALLERHLPLISLDPNYNRNYSLRQSHALDLEAVADWNPRFRDRPRFLGAPLTTGAGQYRIVAPFKALAKAGLAQCTIVHPIAENRLRALTAAEIARLAPDTVVYQNCIEEVMIRQMAESVRLNPAIDHIATIDDRLGDLPRENPHHALHLRQGRTRLRESLSHCKRLIVTTESLRAYFEDLIDDIRVVPNRLENEVWGALEALPNEGRKPRVGWVGAMQHAGDLRLIEPIMRALSDDVDFVLMGMCPDFLKPFVKEVQPFVSIQDYPARMASLRLDLALAPLEIHPFNESKSNLRLLEYGALGWPVICTDIDPYRTEDPPVLRLPNDHAKWIAAIRERLSDRNALQAQGRLLREWVHAKWMLEDGLQEWLHALAGK